MFTQNSSGTEPTASIKVLLDLRSLGFTSACTITDLWTGKMVGKFTGEFVSVVKH